MRVASYLSLFLSVPGNLVFLVFSILVLVYSNFFVLKGGK